MKPLVQLQEIKKGKEEVNETHETNEKTARRPAGSDYGAGIWNDSIGTDYNN